MLGVPLLEILCRISELPDKTRADALARLLILSRLRRLEAVGLSQEDLAHALGVGFATVNRWENGKTVPSKLACKQFKMFCEQKRMEGLLVGEGNT